MNRAACPFVEGAAQGFIFLHLADDGSAAAVGPSLHIVEGFQGFVEASKAVHDRTQGNACQFLILIAELTGCLADDILNGFENLERAFFGPVGWGVNKG